MFQVMPVKTLPQYTNEYKGRANSLEKYPYRHINMVPNIHGSVFLFSKEKELLFISETSKTVREAVQQLLGRVNTSGYAKNPSYYKVWEEVGVGYLGWSTSGYNEGNQTITHTGSQFINSLPVRFRQRRAARNGGAMCCPPD